MRKLASIQRISALTPIEGADSIECAKILGWNVVVKKGQFTVGDLCVYVEIDSILPERPEFEFMKPRGMRVRTVRLRGQVSQGIAFPMSILPEEYYGEDDDVTEDLAIVKYEPKLPTMLSGEAKGPFPSFIPKTDETRVQVLQRILDKYKGTVCYVTEKLDGSSITVYLNNGDFGVCSRNLDLTESSENAYWQAVREIGLEEKMRHLGSNIALQGELIGPGVQGNKLGLAKREIRFFNAFDIDRFEYLNFSQFTNLCSHLGIKTVPIIGVGYQLENDIDTLVKRSVVRSLINPSVWAEGIVVRPLVEKLDLILSRENFNNGRVSFKVINPEFLLQYGE